MTFESAPARDARAQLYATGGTPVSNDAARPDGPRRLLLSVVHRPCGGGVMEDKAGETGNGPSGAGVSASVAYRVADQWTVSSRRLDPILVVFGTGRRSRSANAMALVPTR